LLSFSGHWGHWINVNAEQHKIENSRFHPADGPYDSQNPRLVDRQVAEAERAGITGWIYSSWGTGTETGQALPPVLDTAARHQSHVPHGAEAGAE
jgi:hypothetical protein